MLARFLYKSALCNGPFGNYQQLETAPTLHKMRLPQFWRCRDRQAPIAPPLGGLPECPLPYETPTHYYERLDSVTSLATTMSSSEVPEYPSPIEHYPPILPRVLLTSDLGKWKHQYHLRFYCVLAGDSPFAIFTTSDWKGIVHSSWIDEQLRHPSLFKVRCCWRKGLPRIQSPCTVRATIRNRWQYKICRKAIIRWDAELGILLVDYRRLLADYDAQERSKKNRRRVEKIVGKFHQLEVKMLRDVTGGSWGQWGDWDIFPASQADVARACRLEGRGFKEGLGKMPGRSKKYRVRRCLKDITKKLKRVVLK